MDMMKQNIMLLTIFMLIPHSLSTDPYMDQFYGSDMGYGYGEGYLNDWAPDRQWGMGGRLNQPRCVDIPSNMSLCQDIGYRSMRLPNLLEHDTIQEVLQQSSQWLLLLNRQCSANTKLFLCSLFSPVCLDRPIYPCRSLCESVKAGCEQHMVKYGYPWPEMLNCDKFPLDNGLCIGPSTMGQEEEECTACKQPNTYEAIVDNYCSSSSVYRTKLRSESTEGSEMVVKSGKKIRKIKGNDPTPDQRRNGLNIYLPNSQKCECGLGHDQSPDYYAMGNYVNGKFYGNAFHLYERNNADLKRALRAIRKHSDICENVGLDILVDRPQPSIRTSARRTQNQPGPATTPGSDVREERRGKNPPTAEEIAQRKAERNERRRRDRLAQKQNGRQQSKEQRVQPEQTPGERVTQPQPGSVSRPPTASNERARPKSRERGNNRERGNKRERVELTAEERRIRDSRRRERKREQAAAAQD